MSLPDTPAESATDGHPQRRRILAVCCLSLVLVVVAVSSLNVAIPTLQRALAPTATELLWIIDAYALVFAGLLLPAGALGDRFGRRRALQAGLTCFALGALASSVAAEPWQLIATRSIMGIGAAFIMPATLSVITSVFPPAERPKAIATWAGFAGAGGAIGPLMSGALLSGGFSWGSVFLVNIPIALVALAMVTLQVPESADPSATRLDPIGALLSIGGLFSLLFAIIEGPHEGWTSPIVITGFGLAVVALTGFVFWERRTDAPMLDPRFFRIPAFAAGSATITLTFFAMFGMFFLLSQYFQFVHGYSPLSAAIHQLPSAATLILVSPRGPRVVAAIGTRRTTVLGLVMVTAGLLIMSRLGVHTPYGVVAVALVLLAGGMGVAMPPATSAIVGSLPMHKAGVGSAVNDTTREVGGALGIAILGSIVTSVFRSDMTGVVAGLPLPDEVRSIMSDSIGGAIGVLGDAVASGRVPADTAQPIIDAAREAFVHGSGRAFLIAAGVTSAMALIAWRAVPDTRPTGMTVH